MMRWAGIFLVGAILAAVYTGIQMLAFGMELTVGVAVALGFFWGWVDREVWR